MPKLKRLSAVEIIAIFKRFGFIRSHNAEVTSNSDV